MEIIKLIIKLAGFVSYVLYGCFGLLFILAARYPVAAGSLALIASLVVLI